MRGSQKFTFVVIAASALAAACGVLPGLADKKDDKKKNETCKTPPCECKEVPQALPNERDDKSAPSTGGEAGSGTGGAESSGGAAPDAASDAETLPINQAGGLWLDTVVGDPVPGPASPGGGAAQPAPDACANIQQPGPYPAPNPKPLPLPAPSPNPQCNGVNQTAKSGADLVPVSDGGTGAGGGTSGGGAEADMPEPPINNNGGQCAGAIENLPKNVAPEGKSEKLGLTWKVIPKLFDYQGAVNACAALGSSWRLISTAEIDRLFAEPDFRHQEEVDCLTAFWTGPAQSSGYQCLAAYRGFRYRPSNPNNPLPINSEYVLAAESASGVVTTQHSVMCVEGLAKPSVACGVAVAQLFGQSPLGIVDPSTGLTWARITIKEFEDSAAVEKQCAVGAAQGWRIPTRIEVEQAIKNDVFKTKAYGGTDKTCQNAWHKPDNAATNKTCANLGAAADGAVSFFTDAQCLSPLASTGGTTGGADSSVAAPFEPPSAKPFGLCVKDKK